MIDLKSPRSARLAPSISEAIGAQEQTELTDILQADEYFLLDVPLAIISSGLNTRLSTFLTEAAEEIQFPAKTLKEWIKRWRNGRLDMNYDTEEHRKRAVYSGLLNSISEFGIYLNDEFRNILSLHQRHGRVPTNGAFLYFTGGLKYSLIVEYNFIGEDLDWRVVDIFEDPKAVFDIGDVGKLADMESRNVAKAMLASGHKIVIHRGVLIHVDRRRDAHVFGPTIDTLVLAEILAQKISENDNASIERALEIGTGNGLLTCHIFTHCSRLKEFYGIDSEIGAITCTRRNLDCRSVSLPRNRSTAVYLTNGPFKNEHFPVEQLDLIVCNPPYIPIPPEIRIPAPLRKTILPTCGTDLLELLLIGLPGLLKPDGQALLMISSVCRDLFERNLPVSLSYEYPLGNQGLEVPFDVEPVLRIEEFKSHLLRNGATQRGGDIYHRLLPVWIRRR